MQVMQAVKLVSESTSHWAFFRFDQLQLLKVHQLHTVIAVYMLSKIYIWMTMLVSTKSPLKIKSVVVVVNKGSESNSVCYTKLKPFTHVLFSQCKSLSQAMSNQTKCSTMSSLQIKWFNKYFLCGNTKPNNSAHVLFFAL